MNAQPIKPFPALPGNLPLLNKAAQSGELTYGIDWSGLPLQATRHQQATKHLRKMERKPGTIENQFRIAALAWIALMPWPCALRRVSRSADADIMIRFYQLTVTLDHSRMMTSSVGDAPASIWVDTGATPWGLNCVNGFWASIFGNFSVSIFNMFLHEFLHTIGAGHSFREDSVMYAPEFPGPGARQPDLFTRELNYTIPLDDQTAFREFCKTYVGKAA